MKTDNQNWEIKNLKKKTKKIETKKLKKLFKHVKRNRKMSSDTFIHINIKEN